jgi:hypothetical protein
MRPLKPLRSLRFRPRRLGDRVSYTPEQIERYKSPWERLKKAQKIYANWNALVREEPINPDLTLYRIASERSPWGYWTVSVEQNVGAVYAGYRIFPTGNFEPGIPPGLNYSISFVTINGVPGFPYPTGVTFGGSPLVSGFGDPDILTPAPHDGQPLSALIGVVPIWFLYVETFEIGGQSYIVFLFRWRGPLPNPPEFIRDGYYTYSPDVSDPLGVSGTFYPIPPGVDTLPPLEIDPPANFSCDCPDWAKIEEIDPNSPYPSRWQRREWVLSDAGCLVNDQGIGCKHTIAVALKLGIPFP